ncbi:hypothetical protein ACGFY3_44510 [Streptomyces mirabilis]
MADTDRPLRARDLCEALELGFQPKNIENKRSKPVTLVTGG